MPSGKHWDAVIIGSGFGGSTVAFKLAEAGLEVLVLEKGRWVDRDESAWDTRAIHLDRKYKGDTPYESHEERLKGLVYPNNTVGGSSVFYGAASFRMRVDDFRRATKFARTDDERHLVDWPITYDDLAPFYDQAERMLGVAGVSGVDPTEPPRAADYDNRPPPYASPSRRVAAAGKDLGLKPFPIPLAINFNGNGRQGRCVRCLTCDLYPCKVGAKNDLSVTVLPEAVKRGAVVSPRCTATRISIKDGRVSGVTYRDEEAGRECDVTADLVVVSGGAIPSARLLMMSGLGDIEPNGRLVGRYLMRHCSGIVAGFFPRKTNPEGVFHKQVAITDFYFGRSDGKGPRGPWGMIQSLQVPPPDFIRTAPFPVNIIGPRSYYHNIFLMCIAEDIPQLENRVELHPEKLDAAGLPIASVHYRHHRLDLARREALYREARRVIRKAGAWAWVRMPISTYSHALGTCRMGVDPEQAVLDPTCRFFGLPNLYVVDASFMPTAAAVNPSLTIAANGLRVGDHIVRNWSEVTRPRAE